VTQSQNSAMLLGALVADAAALGVHWIYEPERIAEIAARRGGHSAFTPVDAANFENTKAYFAHAGRRNGMLTQYGEVLRLTIQSMNACGGAFDVAAYQSAFTAHFGPGGTFQGYIDKPTRGALINIAEEKTPSGIDDDQNPAVARLPAIFARYHEADDLHAQIISAMEVTNVNDVAAAYNLVFADLLSRVSKDAPLADALDASASNADASIQTELLAALATKDNNSVEYAGLVGRACHLPTAGPTVFHILKHASDYRDAVERNTRAGGDSAGRAIILGAVIGCVHGVATETGIPLEWVLQLEDGAAIWSECVALSGAR
jgi:ADP-ribosylglycohydrolase